jgi:hypothetical protein
VFPEPSPATRVRLAAPLWLAVLCAAGAALAQQQLNPQLNTELYGRGVGSVRQGGISSLPNRPFYQANLPSDWRNQAFLSGALRSEIRGAYLLEGPLAPTGNLAYIPQNPRPFGTPRPYATSRAPAAVRPPAARSITGGASTPTGSIRQPVIGMRTSAPKPGGSPTPGPASFVKPPLVDMSYGALRYSR